MKRFGDTLDQIGLSVAADANGNVIVAGVFQGTIDFGAGPLSGSVYDYDVFVAKLDPEGNPLWSRMYPGGTDLVRGAGTPSAAVAVMPSGNVVLGGTFSGTADFGAGPVTASSMIGDGFVVALDPSGDPLWSAHYGDPLPDSGTPSAIASQTVESVTADASGNVLLVGYRDSGAWGGMFVVKLDPSGAMLWRKDISASGTMEASVRTDAAGNVFLAGLAYDPIDFGAGVIPTSPAIPTFFRAKLSPAGAPLWSKGVLTFAFDLDPGSGLAVDPSGNLFVAGGGGDPYFDAGCGLLPIGWVAKLLQFDGTTGACRWTTGFNAQGAVVAVDPEGRAVVASNAGDRLVTYPNSGAGLPTTACDRDFMQPGGAQGVTSVATDRTGSIVMTGAFTTIASFGDDPSDIVESAGLRDVFLARF